MSLDAHDRIADELAGAVVGDLAATVGGHDLDAALAVEVLAQRQLVVGGAPPARVHGRVLQQEQRVGQLLGLALCLDVGLDGERVAIGDGAEWTHPQLIEMMWPVNRIVRPPSVSLSLAAYNVNAAGSSSSSRIRPRTAPRRPHRECGGRTRV